MNVILDNRIRIRTEEIPKDVLRAIKDKFSYNNPEFFKRQAMGYYTGGVSRLIATWDLEAAGAWFTLPRGALGRLKDMAIEAGIQLKIDDRRYAGPPVMFVMDPEFKWRDYQIEAIESVHENQTCLIQGGPASGKSEILLGAIVDAGLKAGILVHDKKLFKQWLDRIQLRLGIPIRKIGKVGGGYGFKIGSEITVIMQQTAKKLIDDLYDKFGFIGQDECHHASAPTFLEVLDRFTARYKVGASATIKRQDLRHFLIHDQFGEIAFSIDRNELVERGYTTDVELVVVPSNFYMDYLNEDKLRKLEQDGEVDLSEFTHKQKLAIAEELGWDEASYPIYLNEVAINSERNNLIYRIVKKEFEAGSRIVIFTKRRYHCELFRKTLERVGIEVVIFWGSRSRKEDERMNTDLDRLRSGSVRVAIGNVLDEGLDFPSVDVGIITYRNAKNPGQLDQQAGRLARLFKGKKQSRLYYIHDGLIPRFKGDLTVLKKHFNIVTVLKFPKRVKKIVKGRQ